MGHRRLPPVLLRPRHGPALGGLANAVSDYRPRRAGGLFEDGTRLEIQTGASTVVFDDGPERVLRVASALRSVNVDTPAGAALPAPTPGALDGTLECA